MFTKVVDETYLQQNKTSELPQIIKYFRRQLIIINTYIYFSLRRHLHKEVGARVINCYLLISSKKQWLRKVYFCKHFGKSCKILKKLCGVIFASALNVCDGVENCLIRADNAELV